MSQLRTLVIFLAVTASSVAGIAAVDLVLPAIPVLPDRLGGTPVTAQLVLAAFSGGLAAGFLVFGALGDRFHKGRVLIAGTVLFALLSLLGVAVSSIEALVALRVVQGLLAAAPGVVGVALLRGMFDEEQAIRALSTMGSIESLTPALAPLVGAWLLDFHGWQASFAATFAVAGLAAAILVMVGLWRRDETRPVAATFVARGVYRYLMRDPAYLRYALGHAWMMAAMLAFVFSLPYLITATTHGTIRDFILIQFVQVAVFIAGAQAAPALSRRLGVDRLIAVGSAGTVAGGTLLMVLALAWPVDPLWLAVASLPFFLGVGFRGGAGFVRALDVSDGNHARAAALLLFLSLGLSAVATAAIAPWIKGGLMLLAVQVTGLAALSMACQIRLGRDQAAEARST